MKGETENSMKLYTPQETRRQTLINSTIEKYDEDEYGNKYTSVNKDYDERFWIRVNGGKPFITKNNFFPVTDITKQEHLQSTEYSMITKEIRNKAGEITKNSETELEAVRDLTLWANNRITYNSKYSSAVLSSSEILQTRSGVCDEYTNLYVALARSVNLPSRVVSGIAFTGSEWVKHAWAETYVGNKWVPVDPTFGEVGQINAMHIKLYSAPSYIRYIPQDTKTSEKVLQIEKKEYEISLEKKHSLSSTELAPKQPFQLKMNLTNKENTILTPTYFVQTTEGIKVMNPRKIVLINPGKTKEVVWDMIAPYGEREKYYLNLKGPKTDELIKLNVNQELSAEEHSLLEIKDVFTHKTDGGVQIESTIQNKGNKDLESVELVLEASELGEIHRSLSIPYGETREVNFFFPKAVGEHNFELKAITGNRTTSYFGTISVEFREQEKENLLISTIKYLKQNTATIFAAITILLIIGIITLILHPYKEGPKIPFEEKEEWEKLMNIKK